MDENWMTLEQDVCLGHSFFGLSFSLDSGEKKSCKSIL